MKDTYDDQELLNIISGQLAQVTKSFDIFEVFKTELKDVLNKFIGGHNSILQELFVIRNNQANETKFKNIEEAMKKMKTLIGESLQKPQCSGPATSPLPSVSAPAPPLVTASVPISNHPKPKFPERLVPVAQRENPRILFVGDSIIGHANISAIADATEAKVVTTKAYSAVYVDASNKAKEASFYPKKNFLRSRVWS